MRRNQYKMTLTFISGEEQFDHALGLDSYLVEHDLLPAAPSRLYRDGLVGRAAAHRNAVAPLVQRETANVDLLLLHALLLHLLGGELHVLLLLLLLPSSNLGSQQLGGGN